jgi:DNA-binding CsgD family transcriptional regulator
VNTTVYKPTLAAEIIDAAINPALWQERIDQLVNTFGGQTGTLLTLRMLEGGRIDIAHASSIITEEFARVYNEKYHKYEEAAIPYMMRTKRFQLVTDVDIWPDREAFDKRPDVIFASKNVGFYHRIVARINEEPAYFETFAIQYPNGATLPDEAGRDLITAYLPTISSTVRLGRTFSILKARFNATLSVLDRYRIAVMLVLSDGTIVLQNRTAEQLMDRQRGIAKSRDGKLAISDAEATGTINELIHRASRTANAEDMRPVGMTLVRSTAGADPILCEVSAVRDSVDELGERFRGAILSIYDPKDSPPVSLQGFGLVYSLTKAEEAITRMLLEGLNTDDIAGARSVSIGTVRNQIKSIMAKTGSHTRAELVRKASNANLPIDNPDES